MDPQQELDVASIIPLYVFVVFEMLVAQNSGQPGPVAHEVANIKTQIPSLFRGDRRAPVQPR